MGDALVFIRSIPLGFAAAVLAINAALLLAWRVVFSLIASRRAGGSRRAG